MKKIYITMVCLLMVFCAFAQEFSLGKVSKEELMQKVHPTDSSAVAAILYKSGKTYFTNGFNLVTETVYRIKIYKKEGYEYASDAQAYYTGGSKPLYTDAYTYNLVGDKIEKTKLKSDGEFDEKINDNYSVKKITMPNVKEGSVIEYRTESYSSVFDDFYFQYEIPVDHVRYEVATPIYFNYGRHMKGFINLTKSPEKRRRNINGKFDENYSVFTAVNVPALKEEPYVNNIENYRATLSHELISAWAPGRGSEQYSTNWDAVADNIYKDDDFGKELGYKSYFEDDVNALVKELPGQREKLEAIFSYVQKRMTWTERNGYSCRKGVKKAYEEKTGNTAEINLMLIAMLRHAGLDANPVLVSTRTNGIALYPSLAAYNYVIAAVDIDGQQVLLDATSKNINPDMLPVRALNWRGRLIKKSGESKEIELMPKKLSKDVVNIAAEIDADGKVTGKARDQYFDYNAYIVREAYGIASSDKNKQRLEKQHTGLEVGEHSVSNTTDLSKPVIEEFTFTHNGLSDVIGDKIYISPMLFFAEDENPFKLDKREFPVDFSFPHQDKYMINLKIPAGYTVESVPKPITLAMEQNMGTFKYVIEAKNNQISIIVNLDINNAIVSPQYYQTLKDFYQKMIEKQNEKVILKKV